MNENRVSVRVWGDFACFTRPEMKVERVSYPLITPSAARGILEAIFWEPQMYYLIEAIRVVKKGRWVSFRRNEVTSVVILDNVTSWIRQPSKFSPIQAGGGAADGTQRNMLALEDIEYVITAEVGLSELGNRSGQKLNKYLDEIDRRAKQGKYFHRPSLGMREFAADFEWESDPQAALKRRAVEVRNDDDWRKIWPEEDLGLMLYDVFDHEHRQRGFRWLSEVEMNAKDEQQPELSRTSGRAKPLQPYEGVPTHPQAGFFRARIKDAKMECHPTRVALIRKP